MSINGAIECKTQGRRGKDYRVHFVSGDAVMVEVQIFRQGCKPYWQLAWNRLDGVQPSITASCAIRAALAKVCAK